MPLFISALLANPDQIFGPEQALNLTHGLPAISAPDTEYFYSNTNYTVLGQIIEAQTGKPFFDALNAGIFTKAGVDSGFGLGLVKFAFIGGDTFYGFTDGTLGTASSTYPNIDTGAVVAIGTTGSEIDT